MKAQQKERTEGRGSFFLMIAQVIVPRMLVEI
jgi:hypothetical protein